MFQRTQPVSLPETEMDSLPTNSSERIHNQEEAGSERQDADFAELAACIEAGVARCRPRVKVFQKRYRSVVICTLLLCMPSMFSTYGGGGIKEWGPYVSCVVFLAVFGAYWMGLVAAGKDPRLTRESAAAQKLAATDDIRATGSLIDAVHWITQWRGRQSIRPELWRTLERLLPRLTEEQAQELGAERHGLLATWIVGWDLALYRRNYLELGNQPLLGMLHVMTHVGKNSLQAEHDPFIKPLTLLPTLEKWGSGTGAGQDPAVQQAALACREAIRQKMALGNSGTHLLRASAPPPARRENLLRPATETQQTDPKELLRPGDPE